MTTGLHDLVIGEVQHDDSGIRRARGHEGGGQAREDPSRGRRACAAVKGFKPQKANFDLTRIVLSKISKVKSCPLLQARRIGRVGIVSHQ